MLCPPTMPTSPFSVPLPKSWPKHAKAATLHVISLAHFVHVIRTNKIPFIQSRASWPLTLTSLAIVAAGAWLTVSPLANTLGFVSPPPTFWLFLALMLLGYALLTQVVKTWFVHRFGE